MTMAFFFILTLQAALHAQEFKPVDIEEESAESMLNEMHAPTKQEPEPAVKQKGESISGVVRIVRTSPETEVFFKDIKNSYIIPKNSKHNEIFEACLQSSKTGKAVALQVDPKNRRVLFQNTLAEPTSGLGPASNSESDKGSK